MPPHGTCLLLRKKKGGATNKVPHKISDHPQPSLVRQQTKTTENISMANRPLDGADNQGPTSQDLQGPASQQAYQSGKLKSNLSAHGRALLRARPLLRKKKGGAAKVKIATTKTDLP